MVPQNSYKRAHGRKHSLGVPCARAHLCLGTLKLVFDFLHLLVDCFLSPAITNADARVSAVKVVEYLTSRNAPGIRLPLKRRLGTH